MKTQHTYTTRILLMLTLSGLFGITAAAHAQDVHALIIILGSDKKIRDGVEKNEDLMLKMLKKLSDDCTVKLTVMKSKNGYQGEISKITYANQNSRERKTTQQDIIESRQVAEWVANLKPKSQDTVLIYYTGHGEIDDFGTHELIFDPGVKDDTPDRAKISQRLKEKQVRLRMLITDTCSSPSQDLPESAFKRLADVRERKRQNYPSDLFLKHEGFLDITAASPGQFAIAHDNLGGHFTSALLSRGFTATADTNNDEFLSWQETFNQTKARTRELYRQAEFDDEITADLRKNRQTTQEPYAHSLPKPIGKGGGSGTEIPQTIIGQDGVEMVLIRASAFPMHGATVVVADAFYIDKYEVTNAQFKKFVDANPQWRKDRIEERFHDGDYLKHWDGNNYPSGKADHPVVYVSWYAAMAYAEWVGKRLPRDMEWELAAHLPGKTDPWGNTIDANRVNYNGNVGDTTPVGRYAPNGCGLHDMVGNVSEWSLSPANGARAGAHTINNYKNIKSGRILRGGAWINVERHKGVATRFAHMPTGSGHYFGFRCVRDVQ